MNFRLWKFVFTNIDFYYESFNNIMYHFPYLSENLKSTYSTWLIGESFLCQYIFLWLTPTLLVLFWYRNNFLVFSLVTHAHIELRVKKSSMRIFVSLSPSPALPEKIGKVIFSPAVLPSNITLLNYSCTN